MENFPPGLAFAIGYRSEFDNDNFWTEVDTGLYDGHQHEFAVTISNLLPYVLYSARVRLLSAKVIKTSFLILPKF